MASEMNSTDQHGQQYGQQQQEQPRQNQQTQQRHHPLLPAGPIDRHQGLTKLHQHQNQQQFLLSVLHLQQNIQHQQGLRKLNQWNNQSRFPPSHLSRPAPPSNNTMSPPPPPTQQHQEQSQYAIQKSLRCQGQSEWWTQAILSLIKLTEEPRKRKLKGLRVITSKFDRQSLKQPWGLGFTVCNQKYAIDRTHNAIASLRFGRRVIVVKSRLAGLFPGDIILSVDGRPIHSWCRANSDCKDNKVDNPTSEIASYLRSINTVSIVVLRHSDVVQASAIAAVSNNASATNNDQYSFSVSSMANKIWNDLLVPKFTKNETFKIYRNPWFWENDKNGNRVNIPYDDNRGISIDYELHMQEDGDRAHLFLAPIPKARVAFDQWLSDRKKTWRHRYKVYKLADCKKAKKKIQESKKTHVSYEDNEDSEYYTSNTDFWTQQGFVSFHEWLRYRSIRWHRSYSWNKRKRRKIQEDCFEKVVYLPATITGDNTGVNSCPAEEFHEWLKARRVQWKMARRIRKRQKVSHDGFSEGDNDHFITKEASAESCVSVSPTCVSSFPNYNDDMKVIGKPSIGKRKLQFLSKEDQQIAYIDEILEEKERERREFLRKRAERPPIDIERFFDATKGIPDDVVAHCVAYLDPREHGKLLAITQAVSKSLKDRHGVWQMLCPAHWVLPRRPRKAWHELYFTRLRKEHEQHQKRWDDLLLKCSSALFKRDDLQKIEKLIEKAQADFGFDLNYASGVVCERNSILNLAVIHGRHKVVRWLVDTKNADIETSDRGNFTPLLNAAWSGDRWLVRFFLQRRCNRNVKGTQHYTQGIAPPGFMGKTAEEWAEQRGHPEVAKLIRLGL